MKKSELKAKIFEGLRKSQRDILLFRGEDFYKTKPEYLITVNIAREIVKLKQTAYDIIIKVEQKRSSFLNSCIPEPKALFPKPIPYNFSKYKKQRIDIALYAEDSPICPIEVKLFRPSKQLIEKDLQRNMECLNIKGSFVKTTYFACLYYYKLSKTIDCITKDKKRVRKRFDKIVSNLTNKSKLKYSIAIKTIKQNLIKKGKYNSLQIENDIEFIMENSYHFMGVLVSISK